MHRFFWILATALALTGCAATNDSGVALHRKPDLSSVSPGTPVAKVPALKKPLRKEPANDPALPGAEVWLFEWDLPDDGVNNRMFTSVVVKDGLVVGIREETPDKWQQDPQQHMAAKLDSALEDVASLKATAARYHRVASLRENYQAAPYADTWDLLAERTRFIRRESAPSPAADQGPADQTAAPAENQAAPAPAPMPATPVIAPAAPPNPAPGESVVQSAPPRKTLRELEAEELAIRKDPTLTKKERMRRLHDVWKQQREVMSEGALAEN